MKPSEKEKFANAFLTLCAVFEKEPSDVLTAAYYRAMATQSMAEIEHAITRAITECRFFPKPVELLELINAKPEDHALVIANEIVSHLKRYGSGVYPNLDQHPIAKRLMETRWPYRRWASEVLESELKWWVKEFCEAYASYSAVGDKLPEISMGSQEAKQLIDGVANRIPQLRAIGGGAN